MKTFYRTPLTPAAAIAKRTELEANTGVKWDFYPAHGGTHFTPIVTRQTPMDEDAAVALLPYLTKDYEGFVSLSDRTGLSLANVLIGAKTLAQTQRAVPNVNRMGHFAFIRK